MPLVLYASLKGHTVFYSLRAALSSHRVLLHLFYPHACVFIPLLFISFVVLQNLLLDQEIMVWEMLEASSGAPLLRSHEVSHAWSFNILLPVFFLLDL